jgi:hypothetical protein
MIYRIGDLSGLNIFFQVTCVHTPSEHFFLDLNNKERAIPVGKDQNLIIGELLTERVHFNPRRKFRMGKDFIIFIPQLIQNFQKLFIKFFIDF